ncbi:MAG: metallophosphoesterase family protein [Myxococcota bacterium]
MGASSHTVTIAHITDAHVAPFGRATATLKHLSLAVFEDLVAQCRERDVDVVLFGGDNIDNRGHGEADLEAFMDVTSRLDRWFCVPGNHEAPRTGLVSKERFMRAVEGHGAENRFGLFSRGFGSVRIIGIDTVLTGSPGGYVEPLTLRHLSEEIRAAEEDHIVVLGHHPLYRAWEPMQMDSWDREYLVANRHEVTALLCSAPKVRAYLCGHHHASRIQRIGRPHRAGFYHILTSSPVAYPHYARILHVETDGIRVEALHPRLVGLPELGRQAVLTGRKAQRFEQQRHASQASFLAYLVGSALDEAAFLPHDLTSATALFSA